MIKNSWYCVIDCPICDVFEDRVITIRVVCSL